MIDQLAAEDYRSIYAIAGPWVFHTLLEAQVVDRLYLTLACRLLGGNEYDTLLEGPRRPAHQHGGRGPLPRSSWATWRTTAGHL